MQRVESWKSMVWSRVSGPWYKPSRRVNEMMKIKRNQMVKGLAFIFEPRHKHGIFKQ